MGHFSIFHWLIVFFFLAIAIVLIVLIVVSRHDENEIANTWKFRSVIFVILAFVTPLWIVTVPLFLFLAYHSYKAGKVSDNTISPVTPSQVFSSESALIPSPTTSSKAQEIAALHKLVERGALRQEEFEQEKKKILARD